MHSNEKYSISKYDYAIADNPFAGIVIYGCCCGIYGRKVWHSNDEMLRRIAWICSRNYAVKGKKVCKNKHIDDRVFI